MQQANQTTLTTLFLVDTSASMNQRTSVGMSLLDIAKAGIEHYVKLRKPQIAINNSRYQETFLLVTFSDDEPVQCGWDTDLATFEERVRNLRARDLSDLGKALSVAFELLNKPHPMNQRPYENFGHGVLPWLVHPAVVIVLTDGGELTSKSGIRNFSFTAITVPGSAQNVMPYRWDQSIHVGLIQCSGTWPPQNQKKKNSTILTYADFTGGDYQVVNGSTKLRAYLTEISSKHSWNRLTAFCKFESLDMPTDIRCRHRIQIMKRANDMVGSFPIPESYLPSPSLKSFPKRQCPPIINFDLNNPIKSRVHNVLRNKPLKPDFYEILDSSPFTDKIRELAENKPNGAMYPVFVHNSLGDDRRGKSFGYIQLIENRIHLAIHMYDFEEFVQLVQELKGKHLSQAWYQQYSRYLSGIPFYYHDIAHKILSHPSVTGLRLPKLDASKNNGYGLSSSCSQIIDNIRKDIKHQRKKEANEKKDSESSASSDIIPSGKREASSLSSGDLDSSSSKSLQKRIDASSSKLKTQKHLHIEWDVFKIPRDNLLNSIREMREDILSMKMFQQDEKQGDKHSKPIATMGDYQSHWKNLRETGQAPLRDPLSDDPEASRWKFNIPYLRLPKSPSEKNKQNINFDVVDEADLDGLGNSSEQKSGERLSAPMTASQRRALKRKNASKYFPDLFRSRSRSNSRSCSRSSSPERAMKKTQSHVQMLGEVHKTIGTAPPPAQSISKQPPPTSNNTQSDSLNDVMTSPSNLVNQSQPSQSSGGGTTPQTSDRLVGPPRKRQRVDAKENSISNGVSNNHSSNKEMSNIIMNSTNIQTSFEFPSLRKEFWNANNLFRLRRYFTCCMRSGQQKPNSEGFQDVVKKLRNIKGEYIFFDEFRNILVSEAEDYKQNQIAEYLKSLYFSGTAGEQELLSDNNISAAGQQKSTVQSEMNTS